MNKDNTRGKTRIGAIAFASWLLLNSGVGLKLARAEKVEGKHQETMITDPHSITRPDNVRCGEYFDANIVIDGVPCYGYVINDEDSLIKVAQRVCKNIYHLEGFDVHAEKWVVLYNLNDMDSDVIWKGMVIAIPQTAEIMTALLAELQISGKANAIERAVRNQEQSRMTQSQSYPLNTVGGLLSQLYAKGDYINELYGVYEENVTDEFIANYLKFYHLDGSGINAYTPLSELPYPITEVLLTPKEVEDNEFDQEFRESQKIKTMENTNN